MTKRWSSTVSDLTLPKKAASKRRRRQIAKRAQKDVKDAEETKFVTLVKRSVPGWSKTFDCMSDAVTELRKHICAGCIDEMYFNALDFDPDLNDINELLGTPCGCKFDYETGY